MSSVEAAFLYGYFAIVAVIAMYGMHRYRMTYLYYRNKCKSQKLEGDLAVLPRVTVQLPIFNELYVVERLIDAICHVEYPRELLEIQVLDDSTDETQHIARTRVEYWQQRGIDITYMHRESRMGYKAGALAHGLQCATGEFVAVFDADFVPKADFIKRTIPYFKNPEVGMVQVRWGHLNREFSLLTRAQSLLLDGHFIIEHTARNRSGFFFNFNGTAGIWRRSTISDAGGWQHDTLTEDLDLSYRAQLRGWKFIFLPDVLAPAEVPVDINAFKTQQYRWAKGGIQTALKLLPRILKSNFSFAIKREAFLHLSSNCAYLLLCLLAVMMPIAMLIRFKHGMYSMLLLDLPIFFSSTFSVIFFYLATARELKLSWWQRMKLLPFVLGLGIGLALNQAKAVVEALYTKKSEFTRTPKTGSQGKKTQAVKKAYQGKGSWLLIVELALSVYFSAAVWYAWEIGVWASIPFLLLFLFGFLYVGLTSLLQYRSKQAIASSASAQAQSMT